MSSIDSVNILTSSPSSYLPSALRVRLPNGRSWGSLGKPCSHFPSAPINSPNDTSLELLPNNCLCRFSVHCSSRSLIAECHRYAYLVVRDHVVNVRGQKRGKVRIGRSKADIHDRSIEKPCSQRNNISHKSIRTISPGTYQIELCRNLVAHTPRTTVHSKHFLHVNSWIQRPRSVAPI